MRYINEIKEGELVVEHFLCKSKQTLKSRSGKSYLSLKLQDKTGLVDGKVWDLNNDIKSFGENDFIKVEAVAVMYQNDVQLNVRKIRKSTEGEYFPEDYIPSTAKDVTEMSRLFYQYVDQIQNEYIKKLLNAILIDNPDIKKEFPCHSAAKAIHHNYLGGLLEHSLAVTQICDFLSTRYQNVNRDILIASAMLHDVGKIYELSNFPNNEYTDEGELVGHLVIGAELIRKEAEKIPDFPPALLSLLRHCMLAHHGEYEYGSPKLPKTIEAFLLHCADDLDAKAKIFEEFLENDTGRGSWAGYQKMFQRNIRKSDF